ncbi:MAG: hypothetical protein ABIJ56_09660 [Pseudomonadota bacterium]
MLEAGMAALLVVVVAGAGCRGGSEGQDDVEKPRMDAGKAGDEKPVEKAGPAAAPGPSKPSFGGRIVVDTSMSMEGFTKARSVAVVNVHQALADALAEAGLAGTRHCLIGAKLECDGAPEEASAYGKKGLYRDKVSRLDLALRRQPLPARIDPDNPPPPDLLDEARLTVIVTDGMQAAPPGAPAGGGAGEGSGCQGGADPSCVASLLSTRADEGYGIWIVQAALPFKGRHFAERILDAAFFDKVSQHMEEANLNPKWNGITFKAKVPKGTADSFHYQGFKPLLLMVFSRDADLGRRFVESAVRRLRSDPVRPGKMSDEDAVQSAELAPLGFPSCKPVSIDLLPAAMQEGIEPEAFAEIRLVEKSASGNDATAKFWCGENGKGLMAARYDCVEEGAFMPAFFSQKVELAGPISGKPLPARAAAPVRHDDGNNLFILGVNCTVLPPAKATAMEYELRTWLKLDATSAEREWWSALSSDNSYEKPEMIYGLKDICLGVLRNHADRKKSWGRVRLIVTRE